MEYWVWRLSHVNWIITDLALIALPKFILFRLVLLVKLLFNNCSNIGHESFTKMCSILPTSWLKKKVVFFSLFSICYCSTCIKLMITVASNVFLSVFNLFIYSCSIFFSLYHIAFILWDKNTLSVALNTWNNRPITGPLLSTLHFWNPFI